MEIILLGGKRKGLVVMVRDNTGTADSLTITKERVLAEFGKPDLIGKKVILTEGPIKTALKFGYVIKPKEGCEDAEVVIKGNEINSYKYKEVCGDETKQFDKKRLLVNSIIERWITKPVRQ